MAYFSLSIFAADFCSIGACIRKAEDCNVDYLHFDVMDGAAVPLISFGSSALRSVKNLTNLPIDVHLMVCDIGKHVKQFCKFKLNSLSIHVENKHDDNAVRLLKYIRDKSIKPSIAVSPHVDISIIEEYIPFIDEVLIMSSKPGLKKSVFCADTFSRIEKAHDILKSSGVAISVDGALDERKTLDCIKTGARKIIMGRGFFENTDPKNMVVRISNAGTK